MGIENGRRFEMPQSDVPELADLNEQDDVEIVEKKDSTTRESERSEENVPSKSADALLRRMNEAAEDREVIMKAMKERDVAKAEQIKNQLIASLSEEDMADKKIGELEFKTGMENASNRVRIKQAREIADKIFKSQSLAESDQIRTEIDAYFKQIDKADKIRRKGILESIGELNDESRQKFDAAVERRIQDMENQLAEGVAELIVPKESTGQTAAENLGMRRYKSEMKKQQKTEEALEQVYESAPTEVQGAGEEAA